MGTSNVLALLGLVFGLFLVTLSACGGGSGACVGTGGVQASPICKQDWDESECTDWDDQGINGASWSFHGGTSCEELGYTERCSDGSYRLPGAC